MQYPITNQLACSHTGSYYQFSKEPGKRAMVKTGSHLVATVLLLIDVLSTDHVARQYSFTSKRLSAEAYETCYPSSSKLPGPSNTETSSHRSRRSPRSYTYMKKKKKEKTTDVDLRVEGGARAETPTVGPHPSS